MVFHTSSKVPRPVRLSEQTRFFAYESLKGKYGDEALANDSVCLDNIEGFAELDSYDKYDIAVREIAKKSPVRVCDGELLSGSATLGHAIFHRVPAKYKGNAVCWSVSHLTLDFQKVLKIGINGIEKQAMEKLLQKDLNPRQKKFIMSVLNTVESFRIWHGRYSEALKDKLPENYVNLLRVPFEPPLNFRQAIQSLWFTFAFVRLCGNWPGIGRIDKMLGEYLENDLNNGVITIEEAREITAHFFIKGCEWILSDPVPSSGDAQHYQNLILGGTDISGKDITNKMSYLVLEVVEELPIGDFPITVRLNDKTPYEFKEKMADVIRHGGGAVALYGEETVYKALNLLGYPKAEAVDFANDGCWEVQIPGKTFFTYHPFDGLKILLDDTLKTGDQNFPVYENFEQLYDNYVNCLKHHISEIYKFEYNRLFDNEGEYREECPCTVVSMLEEGCIENCRSYLGGGTPYIVRSPHFGGMADTVNSLYAIKKVIFDDKLIKYDELIGILSRNWEGNEVLRRYIKNRYTYYGNDFDEVDGIYSRLMGDFASICGEINKNAPFIFTAGVSTFGRQVEWRDSRKATPFGTRNGDILAPNASPTPGTDIEGVTAAINSYCKADLSRQGTGAALDIAIHPSAAEGENGRRALISLFDGFCKAGGFFMQIDIVDANTLLEAQKNPEKYKSLSVRVSGWNARFVTLDKNWQQMIIEKTGQGR